MTSDIRVARVLPRTNAEGPGTRCAVWVQGCAIRCPGCFNPHLWGQSGGVATAARTLADQVLAIDGITGVTLLGGEPFEQADGLAEFARLVRAGGLTVMTFTGHLLEELQGSPLLAETDLLVDGQFEADSIDLMRPWVGSTNQRFHFLTSAYSSADLQQPDRLEVRVACDGTMSINGWASPEALRGFLRDLGRRG